MFGFFLADALPPTALGRRGGAEDGVHNIVREVFLDNHIVGFFNIRLRET